MDHVARLCRGGAVGDVGGGPALPPGWSYDCTLRSGAEGDLSGGPALPPGWSYDYAAL